MASEGPKTAYELAMERLRQKDREAGVDEQPLTDAQRTAIAEIRSFYDAKLAERDILHQDALRKARSHEEIAKLTDERERDRARLTQERDRKIAEVRERSS
jgi:hypothetical protein